MVNTVPAKYMGGAGQIQFARAPAMPILYSARELVNNPFSVEGRRGRNSMPAKRIFWVGTGVMGAPMAGHLLAAGHSVSVHTRTRARAADLEATGVAWVESPAEGAAEADVVCTMVGYPADVESAVLGRDGVLGGMCAGSCLIDFTTSSPELARRIASEGAHRDVGCLDAPVSGGDVGARNASLSIMVGGEAEVFEAARPLLETVGKTIVYQGPAGAGQHTKMVNQVLIATTMIGVCEGLLYAQRAGLNPETVLKSVGSGAAMSWSLANLAPRILKGDLAPGFYVEHFVKDMSIALAECERMGLTLPGLELAHRLYCKLVELGMEQNGTQALIRALEKMNDRDR